MSKGKPPSHPALASTSVAQWKEVLKDVEEMADEMRSGGLDAQIVHPMLFRYTEYNDHNGPCITLSAQRWDEIATRVIEEKIERYEVLITPKGWLRTIVIILYPKDDKLVFLLPIQLENRYIYYMKQEASEKNEMWLHLDNVKKEYLSVPLYGALSTLGHEDDLAKEPVPVDYTPPEKKKKNDKKK
jgi:hypothetical protein